MEENGQRSILRWREIDKAGIWGLDPEAREEKRRRRRNRESEN